MDNPKSIMFLCVVGLSVTAAAYISPSRNERSPAVSSASQGTGFPTAFNSFGSSDFGQVPAGFPGFSSNVAVSPAANYDGFGGVPSTGFDFAGLQLQSQLQSYFRIPSSYGFDVVGYPLTAPQQFENVSPNLQQVIRPTVADDQLLRALASAGLRFDAIPTTATFPTVNGPSQSQPLPVFVGNSAKPTTSQNGPNHQNVVEDERRVRLLEPPTTTSPVDGSAAVFKSSSASDTQSQSQSSQQSFSPVPDLVLELRPPPYTAPQQSGQENETPVTASHSSFSSAPSSSQYSPSQSSSQQPSYSSSTLFSSAQPSYSSYPSIGDSNNGFNPIPSTSGSSPALAPTSGSINSLSSPSPSSSQYSPPLSSSQQPSYSSSSASFSSSQYPTSQSLSQSSYSSYPFAGDSKNDFGPVPNVSGSGPASASASTAINSLSSSQYSPPPSSTQKPSYSSSSASFSSPQYPSSQFSSQESYSSIPTIGGSNNGFGPVANNAGLSPIPVSAGATRNAFSSNSDSFTNGPYSTPSSIVSGSSNSDPNRVSNDVYLMPSISYSLPSLAYRESADSANAPNPSQNGNSIIVVPDLLNHAPNSAPTANSYSTPAPFSRTPSTVSPNSFSGTYYETVSVSANAHSSSNPISANTYSDSNVIQGSSYNNAPGSLAVNPKLIANNFFGDSNSIASNNKRESPNANPSSKPSSPYYFNGPK